MDQIKKVGGYPSTGSYAGPHTVRAIDYCGHEVIGLQASDELADGSAYMILLDDHMQVTVATVMASSIRPLPEDYTRQCIQIADREDYASTRRNLEELAQQILSRAPETTDDLRAAAVVLSDLADIIDGQDRSVIQRTAIQRTEEYPVHDLAEDYR